MSSVATLHHLPLLDSGAQQGAQAPGRYSLGFALFLVVNAVLFIRPAEIIPGLEGWPIYNVAIVACILASLPVLFEQLYWKSLAANPATLCVVGLLPAIALSHLSHGDTWSARMGVAEFQKIVIYFLLLIGLTNTPRRLERLLFFVGCFVLVIAVLCILQYHGVAALPGIKFQERNDWINPETGEADTVTQLHGPGIFSDPNDLSLILAAALFVFIHAWLTRPNRARRWLAALPLPALAYAFALTRSRGGFLCLASGIMVLLISRFGIRKSIPLVALIVPLMLVLFSGRMTNISMSEGDTGHGRMGLWREGLVAMKSATLFGIGEGLYADEVGQVAHNSIVHGFVELGIFGGSLFVSALYLPIAGLWRHDPITLARSHPELRLWRPCLLAILTGYLIGMCSLSRNYVGSTYLVFGLGIAYCRMLALTAPAAANPLSIALCRRLGLISIGSLLFFHFAVRVLV